MKTAAHLKLVRREGSGVPSEPPPAIDDRELVKAVRAGDEDAATALYYRLRPPVARTVGRLLGASDFDAEDAVQRSLVAVIESIDSFRGASSLEAWACGVSARVVYKILRRRQLERKIFDSSKDSDENIEPISGGRILAANDSLRRVHNCLVKLDPDKVMAYMLHDVCGFELAEVAKMTDVSVAAAQSRLVRGRKLVHEAIGRDDDLASFLEKEDS